MSADQYTIGRMTWLDQVHDDPKTIKSHAREVAYRLTRHFNRKRHFDSGIFSAWPSYQTLAESIGCSSRTVQRAVALLIDLGHLRTKGKGGRCQSLTYYAIINTENQSEDDNKPGPPCPRYEKSGGAERENVDIPDAKRGQDAYKNVDTGVLQTSLKNTLMNFSDVCAQNPKTERMEAHGERSPFKAAGSVAVLAALISGPGPLPSLPPLVARDPRPEWVMDHQAKHGWPDLYAVCHEPKRWCRVFDEVALEMEPVVASGDNPKWQQWRDEYRARGWPLPEAKGQMLHFPECGVKGLPEFLMALEKRIRAAQIERASNIRVIGNAQASNSKPIDGFARDDFMHRAGAFGGKR